MQVKIVLSDELFRDKDAVDAILKAIFIDPPRRSFVYDYEYSKRFAQEIIVTVIIPLGMTEGEVFEVLHQKIPKATRPVLVKRSCDMTGLLNYVEKQISCADEIRLVKDVGEEVTGACLQSGVTIVPTDGKEGTKLYRISPALCYLLAHDVSVVDYFKANHYDDLNFVCVPAEKGDRGWRKLGDFKVIGTQVLSKTKPLKGAFFDGTPSLIHLLSCYIESNEHAIRQLAQGFFHNSLYVHVNFEHSRVLGVSIDGKLSDSVGPRII